MVLSNLDQTSDQLPVNLWLAPGSSPLFQFFFKFLKLVPVPVL
jgi:hypothetical protein